MLALCLALAATPTPPVPPDELPRLLERWADEYVAPIMTADERRAWQRRSTPAERLEFIESFWRRRDPDPTTTVNEARRDYRHRYVEVIRRFAAGRPGWRTDRGRTYLLLGPPATIWRHPGGRDGQGFPTEVWTYHELPAARLERSIELTFVDFSGTGDHRLVSDDQLVFSTRGGLEGRGLEALARIGPDGQWLRGPPPDQARAGRDGFEHLERLAEIQRLGVGPLDPAGRVELEVVYDHLAVRAATTGFLAEAGRTLLAVTFDLPAGPLRAAEPDRPVRLDCSAVLETLDGRPAARHGQRIELVIPADAPADARLTSSLGLTAPPGDYRLKLAVVEPARRRAGGVARPVRLEDLTGEAPRLSQPVLIGGETPADGPPGGDPFRVGDRHLTPAIEHRAPAGTSLPILVQAYGLPPAGLPLTLALLDPGGSARVVASAGRLMPQAGDRLTVRTELDTTGIPPGVYRLELALGPDAVGQARRRLEVELTRPEPSATGSGS